MSDLTVRKQHDAGSKASMYDRRVKERRTQSSTTFSGEERRAGKDRRQDWLSSYMSQRTK